MNEQEREPEQVGSMDALNERLQALATEAGGTYSTFQHDAGLRLKVNVPGQGEIAISYEYGDDLDTILAVLRGRLIDRGLIGGTKKPWNLTFADGKTTTIYAVDEAHAIRLAGRGQPESIKSGWAAPTEQPS